MSTEEVRKERLSIVERDGHYAGSCQGCGSYGKVFEINAHRWVTRFCRECLLYIVDRTK